MAPAKASDSAAAERPWRDRGDAVELRAAPAVPESDDIEIRIKRVKDAFPALDETYELENDNPMRIVFAMFKAAIDAFGASSEEERERIFAEIESTANPDSASATMEVLRRAFETKSIGELVGTLPPSFEAYLKALSSAFSSPHVAPADKDRLRTTPGLLSGPRPLQTQHALARVEQAYADKNFKENRDGDALVHHVKNADGHIDPIDVLIAPINSRFFSRDNPRFFPPPTLPELFKKLAWIGSSGPFTFAVVISLAVECDRPQVNLNDLIKELGLDPRGPRERDEYRALLWECLQLFAQTLVVGKVQGKYRDKKGNLIEFIENSPVIAITGTQRPSEMKLDGSETPAAVSFTLGDFFYRQRDNKQFLAYIGDLRQLAAIPRGKAAGQWATSIGLALMQHWREESSNAAIKRIGNDSHETIRFAKIPTRRELFQRVQPDPNPFEMLKGTHPKRARTNWENAEKILADIKFISKPSVAKKWARQDWQEAWLDEPLDLRPHFEGNAITVDNVREIANAQKAHRRRTRGRKKKTTVK
jgi:hypothetical protein